MELESCGKVFETICRLCLSHGNTENMVCLTDITDDDDDGLSCYDTYGMAVCTITGISIKNTSLALPDRICAECLHDLKQATIFRKRCEASTELLIKFVHNYFTFTTSTSDFKAKLCEYVLLMNINQSNSSPETCKSPNRPDNLESEIVKTEVNDDDNGDDVDNLVNDFSDYEQVEYLSSEYMINKQEEGDESGEGENESGDEHEHHSDKDCQETDGIKKEIHADMTTVDESKIGDTQQVNDKVCDDRDSDSDFYWPDTGEDQLMSESLQEAANRSLSRKERQKKAAKRMISNFDILTDTESEEEEEYQPDEVSSAMSSFSEEGDDADRIKRRKRKKKTADTITYQCNICMKHLSSDTSLRLHIERLHTKRKQKKHICDQCAKAFWTRKTLETHCAHMHELPRYECETCKYKCATEIQLIEHNRTHTGERPYKCDKCEMTFHRFGCMYKHKKLHLERTIQCPQCPKKCHTKAALISHFNSIHHRMYRYDCSLCDASYALSFSLRKHLTEKHGIARQDQGKVNKIQLGTPQSIMENFKNKST